MDSMDKLRQRMEDLEIGAVDKVIEALEARIKALEVLRVPVQLEAQGFTQKDQDGEV